MDCKQKRLQEIYEHLRRWYGIHTQTDFAKSLRYSRNAISLALNGNEKYLTDSLFKNICEDYPGVFNLDYLLTGEGSLLTVEEEVKNEELDKMVNPQPIDPSSLINAALSAKDETIKSLQDRITDLQRTIADKDTIIRDREARIHELEAYIHSRVDDDIISRYPFPIGVAEKPVTKPSTQV